jgi:DNA mismatch endonuclease, patch repair protein
MSPKPRLERLAPRGRRDALTRSQIMSRIRSTDTRPEIRVRSAVHLLGIRYRKHVASLPGKPDLANIRRKWAVFTHGCFFHSHAGCKLASNPKTRRDYWVPKLRRNTERDKQKLDQLHRLGYRVLIIWECETRDPARLASKVEEFFA